MKLVTALFFLGCSAAVMALPAVDPTAAAAAVPTTTKPPGIPPAVVDLISSRLDALATAPGAPGMVVGAPVAVPGKPTAVPPPGVPPAVAKLIKSMLKSYAAPAVA